MHQLISFYAMISVLKQKERSFSILKKTAVYQLDYGSQLVISKPLQEIKNSGNPGGFDYKRYSLFQGITHQVYLGIA